jgi:DNA-binding NarL/FixJ family response regulator
MQHDARTDAAQKTLIVLLDRLKSFVDDEAPDQWDLKIEVATLRASVEAVLQMNPSGAAHLHCALMTAFSIGGRVFRTETALQEEVANQLRQLMQSVTAARHPGSAEKNAVIAKMYKQGDSLRDIGEEVGLSADAVDERRRKMGIPSRRKKSKK